MIGRRDIIQKAHLFSVFLVNTRSVTVQSSLKELGAKIKSWVFKFQTFNLIFLKLSANKV